MRFSRVGLTYGDLAQSIVTYARLRPFLDKWKRVTGYLGAVLVTLVDIGWKPKAPLQWDDDTGEPWELDPSDPSFDTTFCGHLQRCISTEVWKRAANFRHGKGFSEGAD